MQTSSTVKSVAKAKVNIDGVLLRNLAMNKDDRGVFTELYRREWDTGVESIQWNCVKSNAQVLRGFHVHIKHFDYLSIVDGRASICLKDLRPGSPTENNTAVLEMRGDLLSAVTIPPGVGHAFYFHEASMHIYAVSEYLDLDDELGCHWKDPELEIAWPMKTAHISPRDEELEPLAKLKETIATRWKYRLAP